jgi:hypothetical protein
MAIPLLMAAEDTWALCGTGAKSFGLGFPYHGRRKHTVAFQKDAAVKKPPQDPIREDRIHQEAIVDSYGSEEKAMSWYYYLEGRLSFPFQARCSASRLVSPLNKGETVEVKRMAPEDACLNDMLVRIRWQGRNLAVPLSQLIAIDPDEDTAEAIGDWHYWVAQGYLF